MAVAQRQAVGPLRGSDGQVFDLAEASVATKKSQVPEITLGVLLVAGCALVALAWQTIADPSRLVLAVNGDVSRGDIITVNDLQAVQIASNDIINVIDSDQAGTVVGRVAQVDLASGSLLAPTMVTDVASIEPGQALVGMSVASGDLPSSSLRVGSVVDVIVTPANSNDNSFVAGASQSTLVRDASIAEIAAATDRVTLALAVSETDAPALARAVAAGRVRLVAVPEDRPPTAPTAPTTEVEAGQ